MKIKALVAACAAAAVLAACAGDATGPAARRPQASARLDGGTGGNGQFGSGGVTPVDTTTPHP